MSATFTAAAFARHRADEFVGPAIRLADRDLPRIGHMIGVGEDEVHAVLDVEASGQGFNPKKQPKILFEPHVFYRNLPAGSLRDRAVKEGLAYKDWKRGAYGKESDQHPKLARAMAIHETAALKAASWGLGQILGENFVAAGYDSPQEMAVAFVEGGEAEHLAAMVRFIKTNRLDDELRRHDWAGFARGYNGPQYAAHGYHTKLAAAYARWRKIKDTPWTPADEREADPAIAMAEAVEAVTPPPVEPIVVYAPVAEPTAVVLMPAPAGETHDKDSWWERFTGMFRANA